MSVLPLELYQVILTNMNIHIGIVEQCNGIKLLRPLLCDFNFWIQKFKHDKLTLMPEPLPTTTAQWIKLYKHMKLIRYHVEKIRYLQYLQIRFIKHKNNIVHLLPQSITTYIHSDIDYCRIHMKTKQIVLNHIQHFYLYPQQYDYFKYFLTQLLYYNHLKIGYIENTAFTVVY